MFISISKTGNSRYVFCVGDDPKDNSNAWIKSYEDSAILDGVPATFSSFGEAHAFASRVVDERPSCILAKKASFYAREHDNNGGREEDRMIAEGEILSHYNEQVNIVEQRISALQKTNPKDFEAEVDAILKEVDGIKKEIENLIKLANSESGKVGFENLLKRVSNFSQITNKMKAEKKSSSVVNHLVIAKSAIRAFSEAAMLAIAPAHNDVYIKGALFVPETSTYETTLANQSGDLVRLSFDRNLLLYDVSLCQQGIEECGGVSTNKFLTNYWEPIVSSVGHFYSRGHKVVAVTNSNQPKRLSFRAFSISDNSESILSVQRPVVMGKKTWRLAKTAVTVVNPKKDSWIVGDEVECSAKHLPSYFGRTGTVEAVIEKPGRTVCRVDFRRGLGPLWVEDSNIKKVELGLQTA